MNYHRPLVMVHGICTFSTAIAILHPFNFIPRRDKKFYRPATIKRWVVVIYERQARFKQDLATEMVQAFIQAAQSVGMTVEDKAPLIFWRDPFQEVAAVSSVMTLFLSLA
jgi:hypothetical protein